MISWYTVFYLPGGFGNPLANSAATAWSLFQFAFRNSSTTSSRLNPISTRFRIALSFAWMPAASSTDFCSASRMWSSSDPPGPAPACRACSGSSPKIFYCLQEWYAPCARPVKVRYSTPSVLQAMQTNYYILFEKSRYYTSHLLSGKNRVSVPVVPIRSTFFCKSKMHWCRFSMSNPSSISIDWSSNTMNDVGKKSLSMCSWAKLSWVELNFIYFDPSKNNQLTKMNFSNDTLCSDTLCNSLKAAVDHPSNIAAFRARSTHYGALGAWITNLITNNNNKWICNSRSRAKRFSITSTEENKPAVIWENMSGREKIYASQAELSKIS